MCVYVCVCVCVCMCVLNVCMREPGCAYECDCVCVCVCALQVNVCVCRADSRRVCMVLRQMTSCRHGNQAAIEQKECLSRRPQGLSDFK